MLQTSGGPSHPPPARIFPTLPPRVLQTSVCPAIPCLPGSSQLCPSRCLGPQGPPATPTCQDLHIFAPQGASDLSVPSHPPPASIFRTLPSKVLRTSVCPSNSPPVRIFTSLPPQGASDLSVPHQSPACQDLHIFAPKCFGPQDAPTIPRLPRPSIFAQAFS